MRSSVSSGWNDAPRTGPCRTSTGCAPSPTSTVASTSTSRPTAVMRGARMKTVGIRPAPSTSHVPSKLATCRPYPLRRTSTSRSPSACWSPRPSVIVEARSTSPAHVPNAGIPARSRDATGASSPEVTSRCEIAVDSPPGRMSASTDASSSGVRTGLASHPRSQSAARCSRTSPCKARTPTRTSTSRVRRGARRVPRARRRASRRRGRSRPWPRARRRRSASWPRRPRGPSALGPRS